MKKKPASQSAFFNPRIILSFVFCSIGVFLALLGCGAFSTTLAQAKVPVPDSTGPLLDEIEQLSPADNNGRFVQLIEFAEPGLLRRQGHTSGERFRMDTPQARAGLDQLKAEQAVHVQAIARALGRQPEVTHHFMVTHSGIATRLTPAEAQIVRMLPGVVSVQRERVYEMDTFRSPLFIGADKIWDGTAVPGGVGTRGQGIIIAELDSGLDPNHPSFANDATCGHGVGGAPNKVISLLDCATTDGTGLCNGPSPNDADGHGSHTASTAGGNVVTTSAVPPPNAQIQGVAPCANIRAYKVCPGTQCPGAAIQAGMDSVLLHGDVDVMNFSISGGTTPWSDNDRKKLDIVNAGVVVVASAGNTSAAVPNPVGQVGHRGPWVMTVAASTKDTSGPGTGDILAGFSRRGPIAGTLENLTKPDVTGPGVGIYAAFPGTYGSISGTSMSTPHLTGGAALLRALFPTWAPPEVKSALMMTAFNGGRKENGTTPWDPDDVGTGRIDLTTVARAGLVMNETFANFLAANPSIGGDPRTLNIPSVRDMDCSPSCVWTRTVRNTKTVATNWTATGNAITPGFTINIQPSSFNFTGNLAETQLLTITATPIVTLTAAVAFGEVVLTETGAISPNERITVAIKGLPAGVVTPTPTPTTTPGSPTPTPTPTPTPSPTPTPTPSPTPTPTPSPTPVAQFLNLSTRLRVQAGASVGIGGFIITGTAPKRVILRGIGPSLTGSGVPDALADPVMELHGPKGFTTIINNNWRDTQEQEIKDTGIAPTNDLESAIVATLNPGTYSAILQGNNSTSGVALIEAYDLSQGVPAKLANISTRAFVGTGSNAVIAGFILGGNSGNDTVVLRGIGPSLIALGVPDALADPTLELHNGSGTLLFANDNWQDNPAHAAIISGLGLAPSNNLESAIVATLGPGNYTALLAGQNSGTGVGLVEVYDLGIGGTIATPTPGTPTPTATATATAGGPTPTATATATAPVVTPTPGACVENFDNVTAPALPPGWVASNPDPGDGVLWVTSNLTPDNPPNDAFIPDQDGISDKVLDRTGVAINSTSPVMTFRNHFDTEVSDGIFWDGFVLEVSAPNISGGAFLDVTDSHIGGSITSGGYTGVISLKANNPLAGRMAWSGSSGGYIDTAINLGPNLNGQTVTLRFRMGTDEAVAAKGVRVDHISITGASCP